MKYTGYNNYITRVVKEVDERINHVNVIANENYMVCMNQDGTGFSKYKNRLISRYKETNADFQGIQFYFKNIRNGKLWTSYYHHLDDADTTSYTIEFSPDKNKITKKIENLKTTIKNVIVPNESVEIRSIKIKNMGNDTETIQVSSVLEPVLSTPEQDNAHKAFNNLFLKYEKIEKGLLLKRKARDSNHSIYLAVGLFSQEEGGELEYEIDKQKLYGRLNDGVPSKIKTSEKFSSTIGLVVDPIVSFRRTVKIPKGETVHLNFIVSVGEDKLRTVHQLNQYTNFEKVEKVFEISKIRTEEEEKYLGVKGDDIETYQKLISYLIKPNPMKKTQLQEIPMVIYHQKNLWKYGISGDKPILVAKIKEENDIYTIQEILKAYEYSITKKVEWDLIILDSEVNVYEMYIKEEIERKIHSMGLNYLINHGIYLLTTNQVKETDIFLFKANLILDTHKGNLKTILKQQRIHIITRRRQNNDNHKGTRILQFHG